jgi:hypothetical protein
LTEPAVSIAFFDPAHRLSGTVRAGMTLLFEGATPKTLADAPRIERAGDRVTAHLGDAGALELLAIAEPAELDGSSTRLCEVTGQVSGRRIACLGTTTEMSTPPAWQELDCLRSVSAVFDRENAVFAFARRPRGARGHGEEAVAAKLLLAGAVVVVERARISTVYDRDGRQRTAGLELWLADEDFPRRASGTARAGASLTLEGLQVNAAVFEWRMEGRVGAGAYDVAVRERREAA